MTLADFPQLAVLNKEEKMSLATILWDSVTEEVEPEVDEETRHLLRERLRECQEDPALALSLEDFYRLVQEQRQY